MKDSFDTGDFNFNNIKNKTPEVVVKALIDYASGQKLEVPEKTQERWIELLNSGEKAENIKGYIDNNSRSIGLPHSSSDLENRNQYIKNLSEISQKTGITASAIHSIAQEYFRDSPKPLSQFNETLKKLPEMEVEYFSINNYSKECCSKGIDIEQYESFKSNSFTTDQIKTNILKSAIDEFSQNPENFIKKMEEFRSGPVIGKELADFMVEVYEEYHSGGKKNSQQERGMDI